MKNLFKQKLSHAATVKKRYEESLVSTLAGPKAICEIRAGDEVISLDGNEQKTVAKVQETRCASIEQIFEVAFTNGAIWRTTEKQQIYCGEGEWQHIKEAVGHKAVTETASHTKVKSVTPTGDRETVYGLVVEGTNIMFVNGIAAKGFSTE